MSRAGGDLLPGFPVALNGRPRGPVTCIGDRNKALVLTTDAGELIRISNGKAERIRVVAMDSVQMMSLDAATRAIVLFVE